MAAFFRQRLKAAEIDHAEATLLSVPLSDGVVVTCHVRRSMRRRRTIAIRMGMSGHLEVSAPARASIAQIRTFLGTRSSWLQRVISQHQATGLPTSYNDGAAQTYLGYVCQIVLREGRANCELRPGQFIISLPGLATKQHEQQQMIKLELRLWLKRRARQKLAARLELWAQRLNVQVRCMSISNARRRWGSCSVDNHIRLNWRLIMAPLAVIDYVCVHELCHVKHKNHNTSFWQAVAQAMPDYIERENVLKRYAALLVAF